MTRESIQRFRCYFSLLGTSAMTGLKFSISIFLLSLYLLSATELYQLLKLPLLIEHFVEHRKEKSDLTFGEFLRIHYSSEMDYDQDYDKDMKLPFKMHNDWADQFVAVSEFQAITPIFQRQFNLSFHRTPLFEVTFIHATYLSSIWQPPRFC